MRHSTNIGITLSRTERRHRRRLPLIATLTLPALLAIGGAVTPAGAVTGYRTTATMNVRSGPGTGYSVVGSVSSGTGLDIQCQIKSGSSVNGSDVWNKLGPGRYVSDYYTNTPVFNGYTSNIPHPCTWPESNGGTSNTNGTRAADRTATV